MPITRRSRKVVRKIDVLTVLKVSLLLYTALGVVFMTSGTLLWAAAASQGVTGRIEDLMIDSGLFEEFAFRPTVIFGASFIISVTMIVVGSAINVLITVLYNLISDVVGGVQLVVLEEVPGSGPQRTGQVPATQTVSAR